MYRENKLQKALGQWAIASSIIGFSVLLLVILSQATSLSNATQATTKIIGVGPIHILEISKLPVDGGYSGSFAIQPGLVYYFAILILIACIGAYISSKQSHNLES